MTLLDAYALIALAADEPAADDVEHLLRAGDSRVVVTNLGEAIDVVGRVRGFSATDIRSTFEPLLAGGDLTAVMSGEREAWSAAELRAKHYDRRTSALSLADCFLLAHAAADDDAIATADPALAAAARSEGVDVVALPDSKGRMP